MSANALDTKGQQRALRLSSLLQEIRANLVGRALPARAEVLVHESLSKRKLSRLLGVSATLINKYEGSEIDPWDIRWSLMRRISRLANLSLEQLDAVLSGEATADGLGQPIEQDPHDVLLALRQLIEQLEVHIQARDTSAEANTPVPWFGRYLRTLLADQAQESGQKLETVIQAFIQALPSVALEDAQALQAVLESKSEFTRQQIQENCAAIATALSAVIEVPVTPSQLLAMLPDQ
ncbi:XRE family transcriptional regulator [Synechococcus elongatus]|uniref:XRE family transcriptional regulator n=1 Tax=Synechococcus elongatus PCC 11802 TaxID=2283154 RepID=A0AAT9JUV5_SYNEL|nr:XRE family transcriptional regulator [Synechococcus elongatus]QFZ91507.1 XRE family transcriptional regulator [Synechococcus elongatus PCC 11802]